MRFHLAALPGEPVGGPEQSPASAFTNKIQRFPKMMQPFGHEVIIYGDPRHDHEGEHVAAYYKTDPPEFTPEAWEPFNRSAARAIRFRAEPGDVLGLMGGLCQAALVDALPDLFPVEYGIGYGGICPNTHKVFESYAWMHTCYGATRGSNTADGSFFDAVINAYFEPELFPEGEDDGYLLYVGRLTERKGVEIVCETARRLDVPLVLAGEGDVTPSYGECVGVVGAEERGELMANATALMCPTIYVEPFGCIAVEAQLCGTPVISTDWGAFTETVRNGESGFRCRTLGEFMWAAENAGSLNRIDIRDYAQSRWSLDAIGPQYDKYFQRLMTLKGDGWYDDNRASPVGEELVSG